MRLKVSGSRQEIREQYMPMLANRIVLPLADRGAVRVVLSLRETANGMLQDALDETIEYMDAYYLGKEDWDAIVELGVDNMKEELILKKIPTATKSAFTRQSVVSIICEVRS
jgi:replication factor C subunit 1